MTVEQSVKSMPQLEAIIREKEIPFDVIIIGGGPAGLTAGIYCGRAGFKTLLIEKAILGGQLSEISAIENYPGFPSGISGIELATRLEDQAKKFGVEVLWGDVTGIKTEGNIKKVILGEKSFTSKTLIIATGTEPKKLNVAGEKEFRGRGVSYCATCDGAFYKDKNIAVVGGGNSAISEAIFLTRFASKVAVIHRRDKLRAEKILADRAAEDPKIYFIWNSTVEKICGKNSVEEIEIRNVLDKTRSMLKVDGVFVYVGESPNSDYLKGLVELTEDGFIVVDHQMKTSVDGIFAAGDICKKTLHQVATAVGDGAIASDSARKYLENML